MSTDPAEYATDIHKKKAFDWLQEKASKVTEPNSWNAAVLMYEIIRLRKLEDK